MCISFHVCTNVSLKKLIIDVRVAMFACKCAFALKRSCICFAGMKLSVCAVQCVGQSTVCVSVWFMRWFLSECGWGYVHMCVCVCALMCVSIFYCSCTESSAIVCDRLSHVSLCCHYTHWIGNLANSVRFNMARYDTDHYTHTEASTRSTLQARRHTPSKLYTVAYSHTLIKYTDRKQTTPTLTERHKCVKMCLKIHTI